MLAVGPELIVNDVFHLVDGQTDAGGEVSQRDHNRWLADDPVSVTDALGQFRLRLQAVARVRLSCLLLGGLCRCFGVLVSRPCQVACRVLGTTQELLFRQACVPDVHGAHLGELGHLCSITRDRLERRGARIGSGEAVVTCRDRETRRHALHVVLERPGKCLVEVVQSEQQRSFG